MPMLRKLVPLSLIFVAACTSTGQTRPASAGKPAARTATPPHRTTQPRTPPQTSTYVPPSPMDIPPGQFRAAPVMNLPGVDGIIGNTASGLVSQFGPARLDVNEGDARKLQFTGNACVLDIYLYPSAPGAEPTATYVDARRASDGLDVDRAACIRALRGR